MARKLPSLNALRAFEAAARHVSLTKAASELHVTHAAISRHVRSLEDWMGVKLFVRHPQGVSLTDAGRGLEKRLTPIFDELAVATSEFRAGPETHSLTISVEVAFAVRWLVPRLVRFQAEYPEIEVNIAPSNERVNFRRDPAELGIRYGEGVWDDVSVEHLAELEIFPVCSPSLIEGATIEGLESLAGFTLIHEETKQWWAEWMALVGARGVNVQQGPMLQDAHLALQAAEAGQGFSLGDNVLAYDALRAGRLVRPFKETVSIGGGYYLVSPLSGRPSVSAETFGDWLKSELRAQDLE